MKLKCTVRESKQNNKFGKPKAINIISEQLNYFCSKGFFGGLVFAAWPGFIIGEGWAHYIFLEADFSSKKFKGHLHF